ncbi:hypothetical protein FGADI_4391 [Fusarium gaditjirri]|uniref:Uncharacterized protein n=1 Tax=Fusarium gaditjirri TaxID=282569 RepID=A0A8H4WYP6_9HYPO|nr:hypothetical protein FGADI_4391 [Fusarium gaditjirri]
MLTNRLLQLVLLAVASLPRLVAAGADPAAAYGSVVQQQPLSPSSMVANASSTVEGELLLEECDPTISICGTTADVKIIRTHNSTSYVTKTKKHIVTTVGQCRDTTVYVEPTPLTVTVRVNTTITQEFVPIVNITSITTSWVSHNKISQCIIKRTSTGLAHGPGHGSALPPHSDPSQQPPPAAGSEGNYNSGQPAPSIPPAGASSAQGSENQSSAPSSSSQTSSSDAESAYGDAYGSASGSGSQTSGASGASDASSSTSSSSSRSSAWF